MDKKLQLLPPVGIFLDPDADFVTAMLASLKNGQGFVSLDPSYPDNRIISLLNQCKIQTVVTQKRFAEKVAQFPIKNILYMDELTWGTKTKDVPAKCQEDSTAYVVFTSGTTGEPKGITITHKNLLPLMLWQKTHFQLSPKTRMLQNLSLTFDFGIQEVLTSILFGGTLVIPNKSIKVDSSRLTQFINSQAINVLYSTPTHVNTLLNYGDLKSVHYLLVGGERFDIKLYGRLKSNMANGSHIINGYGPSEVSINVCMHFANSEKDYSSYEALPIGTPSANNKVYILDADGWPVPDNVLGEIYLGGVGLSSGYVGDREKTEKHFIQHAKPGFALGRLYRTGDFGYYYQGEIIYQKRLDQQRKVNGYRVELTEIQVALELNEKINHAYVMLDESNDHASIIAFYTTNDLNAIDEEIIVEKLKRILPNYMIPMRLIHCREFNLNKNNKIDKKQLIEKYRAIKASEDLAFNQDNSLIVKLLSIWRNFLNLPTLHADTDIFSLSIDSLMLANLHREIELKLKLKFNLTEIFQYPTINKLAARLDGIFSEVDDIDDISRDAINRKQKLDRLRSNQNKNKIIMENLV